MMASRVKVFTPSPRLSSVARISELPILGNRLLQSQVAQMSVQELKQLLDQKASNLVLIDVRYKSEFEIARLPGFILIPYPEIQSGKSLAKIKQLLSNKRQDHPGNEPQLIVICKAGIRSAKALLILKEVGITGTNVTGGIQAWSRQIDSSMAQYSIKEISEFQPILAKQYSKRQWWLSGCGLAVALGTIAVLSVHRHPNLLRQLIQPNVSLQESSTLPKLSGK